MSDQQARLEALAEEVKNLTISPLYDYRVRHSYHSVIGEGAADANLMFVGEAPGENEAKQGRPFVGAAGRVLDELLASIGLRREEVYITNIVKDRPPNNRDPRQGEIELYAPFLQRQIDIIRPKVIVPLGRFSMDFILAEFKEPEQGHKIGVLHGQVLHGVTGYGSIAIVPLYHPAAAFYNQSLQHALREDFQVLKQFV